MATVALSDVYEPLTFNQEVQEKAIELNNFLQSGVISPDPQLSQMASIGGHIGELPFYLGLANTEPRYSNDTQGTTPAPDGLGDGKQIFRKAMQNNSWSVMDLSRELALEDPLGAITNRVAKYWAVNTEKRIINSATGLLLENLANEDDMVNAVHSETVAGTTDANRISADAVIDAAATMGDHAGDVTMIAMHSVQYTRLQKLNLIAFIPDARGEINIPTYLGYRVIVDDSMPVRAGTTDGLVYTTMLFAENSIAYGMGQPNVPSEVERDPASGNGGGEEILYSRSTEIIHPKGYQFTSASVAGQSATYAELAAAANWDRAYANRKNVGIAFLTCN